VAVNLHTGIGVGVQVLKKCDKLVAETVSAQYCEQAFVRDTVECMLEIKWQYVQRAVGIFGAGSHVPYRGHCVEDCVARHPTVLRLFKIPVHEWSETSCKYASQDFEICVQERYRSAVIRR
jgi:hypothetical protein